MIPAPAFILAARIMLASSPALTVADESSLSRHRTVAPMEVTAVMKQRLIGVYGSEKPRRRGENIPGVERRIATRAKVVALTLDACPRKRGVAAFDAKILATIDREKIPATVFVSGRWIDANPQALAALAADKFITLGNHGYFHRPAVVDGSRAYGFRGTRNVAELIDELSRNESLIRSRTGRDPIYFRSGTAIYDDVAIRVIHALGYTVIGYAVEADVGATLPARRVAARVAAAKPGSIIIAHINHPGGGTAEGLAKGIAMLKKKGYQFVRLGDYGLE